MNDTAKSLQTPTLSLNSSVLAVEGWQTKFDVVPVSSSLDILIGDRNKAAIVQQLHYWTTKGYGVVIDGIRWFYKSIKEWIEEVFPTFTPWKLTKMLTELEQDGIIRREKLFTKHQIQEGDRFWWQPKNQTYYYSLNIERLQEKLEELLSAETIETSVFCSSKKLRILDEQKTKDFDCAKNKSDNTSTENNPNKIPPLTPPIMREKDKWLQPREIEIQGPDDDRPLNELVSQQKEKPNLSKRTTGEFEETSNSASSPITRSQKANIPPPVTQKKDSKAPWRSQSELKAFYRDAIAAFKTDPKVRSAEALAHRVIQNLTMGLPSQYWDNWKAGKPIIELPDAEWEISPGVPAPKFVEYLKEKIREAHDSNEMALLRVAKLLKDKTTINLFWQEFKRAVEVLRQDNEEAISKGQPIYVPSWFSDRAVIDLERAAESAEVLNQINPSCDWVENKLYGKPQLHQTSEFDAALSKCVDELREAARVGYTNATKYYIENAIKYAKTEQDKARLNKAIADIYPSLLI